MSEIKEICEVCNKNEAQIKCSSCRMALCYNCAHFELVGSGCGTVYPLYYCSRCAHDEKINPNAGFKDQEW